jgi:hypothetical protein
MIGFKIMDFDKGEVKTLFHGLNGSRTVPRFEWLDANVKENAYDGGGEGGLSTTRRYTAGWHVLETKEQAVAYLNKFRNLDRKVIVMVTTEGKRWKKEHSPAKGLWLCERMRIDGIVMFSQSIINGIFAKTREEELTCR